MFILLLATSLSLKGLKKSIQKYEHIKKLSMGCMCLSFSFLITICKQANLL